MQGSEFYLRCSKQIALTFGLADGVVALVA
jgi:hypothetical protein